MEICFWGKGSCSYGINNFFFFFFFYNDRAPPKFPPFPPPAPLPTRAAAPGAAPGESLGLPQPIDECTPGRVETLTQAGDPVHSPVSPRLERDDASRAVQRAPAV